MSRSWPLFAGLVLACGRPPATGDGTDTSGATSTGTSTTQASGSTGSGTTGEQTTGEPTTGSTDGGTETGECWEQDMDCSFIPCPDANIEPIACDAFAQDCPDGQRCVLMAEDDFDFSVACSDVVANPKQEGEPCTLADFMGNPVDDCDLGLVCRGSPWFSQDKAIPPVCRPICTGTEADPQCPQGMFCELESVPACYSPDDCNAG